MYVKAEEWQAALNCFRSAHDWRQVFCMAARLSYGENQIVELAHKIAVEVKSCNRHLEASRIFEEYAKDPEEAIAVLIEGTHWCEAVRLVSGVSRVCLFYLLIFFLRRNLKRIISLKI